MTSDAMMERYVTRAQFDRLADWSMRKPVIALMGEFSSGKSTLMNLLIGQDVLPTQVTATRRTTSYIRLFVEAEILKQCDLIDTPGISDPNIKTDYWIRTIRYANAVMWCTHAGQAWRESERGSWESLPSRLRETSILLVTRKDKITSERDLLKIQRRLERETQSLFNARMFISLTNAIKAVEQGDAAAWEKSGGKDFTEMLEKIVEGIYVQRSYLLSRYVIGTAPVAPAPQAEALSGGPDDSLGEMHPQPSEGAAVAAPDTQPDTQTAMQPNSVASETVALQADVEEAGVKEADGEEAGDAVVETEPQNDATANDAPPVKDDAPGLEGYHLKDLSACRDNRTNISLSDYRLQNPSLYRPVEQQEPKEPAQDAAGASAPDLSENHDEVAAGKKDADTIRAVWDQIRKEYDLPQTQGLSRAVEKLIDELSEDAETTP